MVDRIAECDSCCFSRPAADSFILSVIPKKLWPTSDARSNLLNMAVKLVAFQSEIFSVWNNRPAPSWLDSAIGEALHRHRWGQSSPKSRKLFGPEKPFLKVQLDYSVKLVFSYVVKGMKIKITTKFRASRRLEFALKIQRELCHPKSAQKVSGLSGNRPLARLFHVTT